MTATVPVSPLSIDALIDRQEAEHLVLVGKDGVGKSSAIVSQAKLVEELNPSATFYVIDSEDKFTGAWKAYGPDRPKNIQLYRVGDMNQITTAAMDVLKRHKPWDWVGIESYARIWERAQNLAYMTIAGVTKFEWLEMEENERTPKGTIKKGSPIPNPDDFWNIAKGAFDRAFLDNLTQGRELNVIASTTMTKPKDMGKIKESADRKAVRIELGIDLGIDGPPRLSYSFKTLALLELSAGRVSCRILRDNLNLSDETRVEFDVPGKREWAIQFFSNCRS